MTQKKFAYEKNSIIVLSLTMLANFFNYFFQIIMGNMMSVADYGVLNALLSFSVILSMIINLFQTFTARSLAMYHARGEMGKAKAYFFNMLKIGGVAAICVLVAGKIASPAIADILKIENYRYVGYTFFNASISIFALICWGALQGFEKFINYSLSNNCASAVKLILAVFFLYAGFGLTGVWAAMIFSTASIVLWGCISLGKIFRVTLEPVKMKSINAGKGFVLETITIQILIAFLTNCDVLFIKAFISDAEVAGVYSAAITLGKIPLFIATTVAAVLLPTVVNAYIKRENTKIYLGKAIAYSAVITILYTVILHVFATPIITLLYGERYLGAVEFLLPVGMFIFVISMLTIMMNYYIACAQTRGFSVTVLAGAFFSFIGVYIRHDNVSDILYRISIVMLAVVLINLLGICKKETILEEG